MLDNKENSLMLHKNSLPLEKIPCSPRKISLLPRSPIRAKERHFNGLAAIFRDRIANFPCYQGICRRRTGRSSAMRAIIIDKFAPLESLHVAAARHTSPTRRIVLAAAGTLLLPRAARAQPTKRRRIAFLNTGAAAGLVPYLVAFREGLSALGYRDEDVAIDARYADGYVKRLPDLAAELVRLAPEVMLAEGPAAVKAAQRATAMMPIVMANVADPVGAGFIASLAHPGGNLTGLANLAQETVGKRLQLLKAVIPGAERIAILINPGNPGNLLQFEAAQQAALTLHIEVFRVDARATAEIDGAFAAMAQQHADALFAAADPVFGQATGQIIELAANRKLPAIYQDRNPVDAGGLISYGVDRIEVYRQVATYVDKILKGAKPADLPVEQPTKFQLVVNLKTAQALGLTIPQAILAGADEVIE
jgi:putative ABC transport system substrate-binding protein